jgi:hypothetical protein
MTHGSKFIEIDRKPRYVLGPFVVPIVVGEIDHCVLQLVQLGNVGVDVLAGSGRNKGQAFNRLPGLTFSRVHDNLPSLDDLR